MIGITTEKTCSESCWYAKEEVCRCSCGGANHGCLRRPDGVQPVRTARIDGIRYELKAVGLWNEINNQAWKINKSAPPRHVQVGDWECDYHWDRTDKGAPAKMKKATEAQIRKWPELSAYRQPLADLRKAGACLFELDKAWPHLLWVKIENENEKGDEHE